MASKREALKKMMLQNTRKEAVVETPVDDLSIIKNTPSIEEKSEEKSVQETQKLEQGHIKKESVQNNVEQIKTDTSVENSMQLDLHEQKEIEIETLNAKIEELQKLVDSLKVRNESKYDKALSRKGILEYVENQRDYKNVNQIFEMLIYMSRVATDEEYDEVDDEPCFTEHFECEECGKPFVIEANISYKAKEEEEELDFKNEYVSLLD